LISIEIGVESERWKMFFWIPAPRFHEDKLRGNDRIWGAQRGETGRTP
jgi:hypothetical protein